ncbi:MAG: helix-turn-helix transcriptional regulator [Microthrixaceae bacterium]
MAGRATDHGGPLPSGTVTLLLGDVESSVRLWETNRDGMHAAVVRLDELVSQIAAAHDGRRPVEQGEGDSFVLAFARADDAVACAFDLQITIGAETWPADLDLRIRMGLHTGDVDLRNAGNYAGPTVNRCARLRSLGHGGQVLLSKTTADVVQDRLPARASLRPLGSFSLRGLARPEDVAQLCHPDLADAFPALAPSEARPNNLPSHLTTVIGREAEIADALTLLRQHRCLTLTGAGGCGKTRLAIEIAAELIDDHTEGVWWIDLASTTDPDQVAATVAQTLGVQESHGDRADALVAALGGRDLVIVLDNCEHLVSACASVVATLISRLPSLVVLATSREALGIDGEVSLRVRSLTVPSADAPHAEIARCASVQLFVERARRVRSEFTIDGEEAAIAEICRRLDGIPLAIELAAGRCRMLSPTRIAAALSDRFRLLTGGARTALPRQRTLEASVDWSYALLADSERAVLTRLSVFVGGFDLDAAEAVCAGDGVDGILVLDLVAGLVDRSLVQADVVRGDTRYRLLETIRAYARQRLVDRESPSGARDRHLDYYVDLAGQLGFGSAGEGVLTAFPLIDADLGNLRVAMDWAMETARPALALHIAGPLAQFWIARGLFVEIRQRIEAALARSDDESVTRARALLTVSRAALMGADYRAGLVYAQQATALARTLDHGSLLADASQWLAWSEELNGCDLDDTRDHAVEAEQRAREAGSPAALVRALNTRGLIECEHAGPLASVQHFEAAVDVGRQHGVVVDTLYAELFYASALLLAGAHDGARQHAEACLTQAERIGIPPFVSFAQSTMGLIELRVGAYDIARDRIARSDAVACNHGLAQFEIAAQLRTGELHYALGELPIALAVLETTLDRITAMGSIQGIVETSALLALTNLALGQHDRARAAVAHARATDNEHPRFPHSFSRSVLAEARIDLDQDALESAEAHAHEALDVATRAGVVPVVADALDVLAAIATAAGSAEEACRLIGAAHRLHTEIGSVRYPVEQAAHNHTNASVRDALGDTFDRRWTEGVALTLEAAVAYAQRGRGERKRPSVGWSSLTPTELAVIELVAQGCTNPEIAEQLFVTRNTVKTHLSHVFTKLGVTTRSELAVVVTRRTANSEPLDRIPSRKVQR